MANYGKHLLTRQNEKDSPDQIRNTDGGSYVFQITPWQRLERFLILGSEGGTYYASERKLTRENAAVVLECAKLGPQQTVETVVRISVEGRAPKQSPAIFALALLASCDEPVAREDALYALPRVCRTASYLFEFISYVDQMRGWGSGLRRAIANWYEDRTPKNLAWQMMKYRQRNDWSHRDVLRKVHPSGYSEHGQLFRWAVGGGMGQRRVYRKATDQTEIQPPKGKLPDVILAFEELQKTDSGLRAVQLIQQHGFTHEMVPNEFKNNPIIWEALLPTMPLGALVRNLGKITSLGLLNNPTNDTFVSDRLTNYELIRKSRLHPMALMLAQAIYASGHGQKGKLTWSPSRRIVEALDDAFYKAFDNAPTTGHRRLVVVDVSGSMHNQGVAGTTISSATAALAMSLVSLRREPNAVVVGFTGRIVDLPIHANMTVNETFKYIPRIGEMTDIAAPFKWAKDNRRQFDEFELHTDHEGNMQNSLQPHIALQQYRKALSIPAKCACIGYTATNMSVADPKDSGMMDFVGLDAGLPTVLNGFFGGATSKQTEEIDEEETETV